MTILGDLHDLGTLHWSISIRGSACSWIFNLSGIFWVKVTSFLGEVHMDFSASVGFESPVISPSNPAKWFFFLQLFIAIPLGTNIIYGTNMEKCENRHQHLDLAKWLLHSHRQVFVSKHLPSFRIWWVGDECHHVSSSNQHKLVGDFPINPPQLEFTRRTSQNDLGKCGITMDTHGFHTWNHSLLDLRVEVHREVPATGKSQGAS